MVENYLDRPGVAELFEISSGVASLVGMVVPEKAKVASQFIRDIDIPTDCVVAAVIRGKPKALPNSVATGNRRTIICCHSRRLTHKILSSYTLSSRK